MLRQWPKCLWELHTCISEQTGGQGSAMTRRRQKAHWGCLRSPLEIRWTSKKKRLDVLPKIADFSTSSISRAFVKGSTILASTSGAYKVLWVLKEKKDAIWTFPRLLQQARGGSPCNSVTLHFHTDKSPCHHYSWQGGENTVRTCKCFPGKENRLEAIRYSCRVYNLKAIKMKTKFWDS